MTLACLFDSPMLCIVPPQSVLLHMSHQISPAPCELVLELQHRLARVQVLVQLWQHLLLWRKMTTELELIQTTELNQKNHKISKYA
jgi:hypothetical protein